MPTAGSVPTPPSCAPRLAGLDLLRLLAALYLVLYHVNYGFSWLPLSTLFSRGPSATSLFFLLSGFLIARLYPAPLPAAAQSLFLRRRLARLLPPYLLGLGLWLAVGTQTRPGQWPPASSLLEVLTLTQTWLPGHSHLLNAPGWSASCLLIFYLLYPLLGGLLTRLGTRALLLILLLLWLPALTLWPALARLDTVFGSPDWTLYLHNSPLTRLPEFLLGVTAALLVGRLPAGAALARRLTLPATLVTVLAALLLPASGAEVDNGTFAPLLLALLLGWLAPPAPLARLTASRPLRAMSSATLCLYLLHYPLLDLARHEWPGAWSPLQLAAFLTAALAVALAADTLLMRPLTAWIRRTERREPPVSPTPAVTDDLPARPVPAEAALS